MTYYNTVSEDGQTLLNFKKITAEQDKDVLTVIKSLHPIFSAKDIYNYFEWSYDKTILMTSIRRSINTLKNAGLIEETGKKVKGLYGRNERQYKIIGSND